jgi:hypothetical protein
VTGTTDLKAWVVEDDGQLAKRAHAARMMQGSSKVSKDVKKLRHYVKARDMLQYQRESRLQQAQSCEAMNRNAVHGLAQALKVSEAVTLQLTSISNSDKTLTSVKSNRGLFLADKEVEDLGISMVSLNDVVGDAKPLYAYVIILVRPGSWAAQVGMHSGNRIKALNRKPVGAFNTADLLNLIHHRPLWIETWSVRYKVAVPTSPEMLLPLEGGLLQDITNRAPLGVAHAHVPDSEDGVIGEWQYRHNLQETGIYNIRRSEGQLLIYNMCVSGGNWFGELVSDAKGLQFFEEQGWRGEAVEHSKFWFAEIMRVDTREVIGTLRLCYEAGASPSVSAGRPVAPMVTTFVKRLGEDSSTKANARLLDGQARSETEGQNLSHQGGESATLPSLSDDESVNGMPMAKRPRHTRERSKSRDK